jgi:hypothetical protein
MNLLTFIVACGFLLIVLVAWVSLVPWIGYLVVKILTFGRIELGWRPSDLESEVSTRIGFFVLLLIAGLVAALVHS